MTAQFGPHRYDAGGYDAEHTDAYLGADFTVRDLRGARLVDCDLRGVRIVDALLVDLQMSGYVDGLVVNGVDVTQFVNDELDRRHPERVQLRSIRDADGFRDMWQTVEALWASLVARAERLPESALHVAVEGEWTFVDTLRHLVYVTDSWASRSVLEEPEPFHRLALPQTAYDRSTALALGMEIDADPTFAEVMTARESRQAVIRGILDGLADRDLGRQTTTAPAPGYPQESRAVAECLAVVIEEEIEHHRFAARDLAVLQGR